MRLTAPRIAALADADFTQDQQAIVAPMAASGRPVLNIFRTLANAPAALRGFLGWGEYVLSKKNDLPAREREIVILRIGYLCRSGYEWTQHVPIGVRAGLTEDEVSRIKAGAGAGWGAADAALIAAADELHRDQFITDAGWAALKAHFSDKQCMDVVFTAGQYTQVCMMLNSFGVQLDAGQTLDPDLKGF
jgi:4-carboxymuconolactone decarboxylase